MCAHTTHNALQAQSGGNTSDSNTVMPPTSRKGSRTKGTTNELPASGAASAAGSGTCGAYCPYVIRL